MSAANNGGSAFPRDSGIANTGMTLRDYFAAKALAGIASSVDVNRTVFWKEIAADAYAAADAMLAERNKP